MSSRLRGLFALCAFVLLSLPLFALHYTVTGLGYFPGGSRSEAYGINNQGQVVGCAYFANWSRHACLWSGSAMIDLGTLGGTNSEAYRINDSSQIVGWANTGSGYRAFLCQGSGAMTNLGALSNGLRSKAFDINGSGVVVGLSEPNIISSNWLPFRLSGGVMSSLGTFGGDWGEAHGINTGGAVVGWAYNADNKERAFRWTEAGGLLDLGTLGGDKAFAYDINDSGVIVGTANNAQGVNQAFVWQNGSMTALQDNVTVAWAINNNGDVVGFRDGWPPYACIWKNGVRYTLNDCIPADSGWHLQQARDINDQGQIVGIGVYDGQFQAFLLTPVAEPYKPDLMIRNAGEGAYVGDNLYNLPEGQSKAQGAGVTSPAVYHVCVQNDGTATDTFTITAADPEGDWTVRYFDALTGGTEITGQVTEDGWSTGALAAGASRAFRVEVAPAVGIAFDASLDTLVTATSGDGVSFDVAQAVTTKAQLSGVTLTATPPGNTLAGRTITLTATPTGGSRVEYRFFQSINGVTTTVQAYTLGANVFQVTPTELGQYQFVVWAREQGSATKFAGSVVHKVNPTLSGVTLKATPAWPQPPGTVVTLKATQVNGGQIEYRFYAAEPGGALQIIQPYSAADACTFTVTQQGTYQFLVYGREVGATVTKQAHGAVTYNCATPITSVDLAATPSAPGTVNTPLTLTATAHGGYKVQYRFFACPPGGAYTTLQHYTLGDNTCEYTPTTPGRYYFLVYVRETYSTRPGKDAYKVLSYQVNAPVTHPITVNNVFLGNTVTVYSDGRPAWSADGSLIAFHGASASITAGGILKVSSAPGSTPTAGSEANDLIDKNPNFMGNTLAFTRTWIGTDYNLHVMYRENASAPSQILRSFNSDQVGYVHDFGIQPEAFTLSGDGLRAFGVWKPFSGYEQYGLGGVYTLDFTGPTFTRLGASDEITDGVLSANGARIAYTRANGNLYWKPFSGGTETLVGAGATPSWSADGSKLGYAAALGFTPVYVIHTIATGAKTFYTLPEGTICQNPVLSPDGTKIAFRTFTMMPSWSEGIAVGTFGE